MALPALPKLSTLRDQRIPWALVVSSFVNKSGDLALSLLPMLLIERQVSPAHSSLILGASKSAQMAALFVSGVLCDLVGFRFVILASYCASCVAFLCLPFLRSELLIGGFAVLGQFGTSLFNPAARSMIRELKTAAVKKSMAWLRAASNSGQVVAALIGIVVGPLGLLVPFLVDGLTSLAAFVISLFTVRNPPVQAAGEGRARVERGYYLYSVALFFFFFSYELGWLSFSGFAKLSLGDLGIRAYGIALFTNTLICGLFAVPAANRFHNARKALPFGACLTILGLMLFILLPKRMGYFALCSLVMTLGELIFSVHAQLLLVANSSGRSNRHYGLSLLIQSSGRMIAGVIVFPVVLWGAHPLAPFPIAAAGFALCFAFVPKEFIRRGESA